MAQRVGIVAVAQTKYEESKPGLRMDELAYQPVKEVLEQTGLKYAEDGTGIDFSVCATDDFWDASSGQYGFGRICRTRRYRRIIADDSDENCLIFT